MARLKKLRLSRNAKIGVAVGGVALLAGIGYLLTRKSAASGGQTIRQLPGSRFSTGPTGGGGGGSRTIVQLPGSRFSLNGSQTGGGGVLDTSATGCPVGWTLTPTGCVPPGVPATTRGGGGSTQTLCDCNGKWRTPVFPDESADYDAARQFVNTYFQQNLYDLETFTTINGRLWHVYRVIWQGEDPRKIYSPPTSELSSVTCANPLPQSVVSAPSGAAISSSAPFDQGACRATVAYVPYDVTSSDPISACSGQPTCGQDQVDAEVCDTSQSADTRHLSSIDPDQVLYIKRTC